eukprot:CAMPEP_0177611882 /NCGR_PEP_ID=MMETSP0419_2-20121207/20829_1 /TAXON_ID=582737 /ORGANISM="Tetraselmis sp., Strain GSL018" /LENGTH=52 /DNA_ID=CAMNT_0019107843 /DNA_START=148 /DNA_END=303 /DNA_ORIENTATION=+
MSLEPLISLAQIPCGHTGTRCIEQLSGGGKKGDGGGLRVVARADFLSAPQAA